MIYDRLRLWYLHCDRRGKDIVIPAAVLEQAIRDAARAEGREAEQYPFETGTEHRERIAP